MSRTHETLVIGAGISGLSFAHALGEAHDVRILEAAPRAGGLVRTGEAEVPGVGSLRFEHGPESATGAESITTLADELGLELRAAPAEASKRFVVVRGRPTEVPLSPPRLLASPLLGPLGKLRLLTEPWRSSARALDGSVADFARHRLGSEALEVLVDPMVAGIHAADPAELSLRAAFPRLVGMIEEHGSLFRALRARRKAGAKAPGLLKPVGGMQRLTDALASRLAARLELGTEIHGLRPEGAGWVVETSAGDWHAGRVVLAVPLGAAARILGGAVGEAAQVLAGIASESLVSVLHAHRRADVEHALDGFGYLVPRREGLRHLGTLFSSSIDPDCAPGGVVLLRTLLGGSRHPELVDAEDSELTTLVGREVTPLLGLRTVPLWSQVARYRNALPRFGLGHPQALERLAAALPPGLDLLGNYTRGIGLASLVEEARRAAQGSGSGSTGAGASASGSSSGRASAYASLATRPSAPTAQPSPVSAKDKA